MRTRSRPDRRGTCPNVLLTTCRTNSFILLAAALSSPALSCPSSSMSSRVNHIFCLSSGDDDALLALCSSCTSLITSASTRDQPRSSASLPTTSSSLFSSPALSSENASSVLPSLSSRCASASTFPCRRTTASILSASKVPPRLLLKAGATLSSSWVHINSKYRSKVSSEESGSAAP